MKNKALFLDRDGVINKDIEYAYRKEQIIFNRDIFDVCRKAVEKGYLIIIITNQAGVAKGYYSEEDVRSLHDWISLKFKEMGIHITSFYFCPYHIDGTVKEYKKESSWRKPEPGMILQAISDFNIDIEKSLVVGDKPSDKIRLDGLRTIIIKSKYSLEDYDVENLKDIESLL